MSGVESPHKAWLWAVGGVSGLLERLINKEGGYDRVKGETDIRAMVLLASLQFP